MGMTVGKKRKGEKVQLEKTAEGGRWLARGAGAACLEHLQTVPHGFHPI